jgi:hypothetical protein
MTNDLVFSHCTGAAWVLDRSSAHLICSFHFTHSFLMFFFRDLFYSLHDQPSSGRRGKEEVGGHQGVLVGRGQRGGDAGGIEGDGFQRDGDVHAETDQRGLRTRFCKLRGRVSGGGGGEKKEGGMEDVCGFAGVHRRREFVPLEFESSENVAKSVRLHIKRWAEERRRRRRRCTIGIRRPSCM